MTPCAQNKEPHSVLLFGLRSSHSSSTVTKSKGGYGRSSTKTSAVWLMKLSFATVNKSLKEAVADPTWIQLRIATRHGICCYTVVCNIVLLLKSVQ